MARRLYFQRTGSAPVSPAFDASWESTGSARQRNLTRTKLGESASGFNVSSNSTSGSFDVAVYQFVSEPLAPQTISGTVYAWLLVNQGGWEDSDYRSQIVVKVVSNNGSTVRGVLLGHDTGSLTNEWPPDYAARGFPKGASSGVSVSPVNVQQDDRLVVEIGYRRHATHSGFRGGAINISSNGSDLAVNESATSGDPWIEFSHDIVFWDEANTPPTITVNPSVNYNGYTRLGPSNTPGSVGFTATDPEETGSNELSYEIRTASGSGGTLVASGNFTSGVGASVSIAHNASGLNEGSNTLWLRVSDGTDYAPTNPSFTLLVDRTQPTVGTITHSPNPVTP